LVNTPTAPATVLHLVLAPMPLEQVTSLSAVGQLSRKDALAPLKLDLEQLQWMVLCTIEEMLLLEDVVTGLVVH